MLGVSSMCIMIGGRLGSLLKLVRARWMEARRSIEKGLVKAHLRKRVHLGKATFALFAFEEVELSWEKLLGKY